MNILYIGTSTSYVTQNDVSALKSLNHDVLVINPYPIKGNPPGGIVKLDKIIDIGEKSNKKIFKMLGGTLTPALTSFLSYGISDYKQIIENNNITLIFATWGSNMIPIVRMIQKANLGIPIVYNFLTYPQNVYKWKVLLENIYCKKTIEKLDGRVFANEFMFDYFKSNFNLNTHGSDFVFPPFFGGSYFYRERLPLLSEVDGEPHVVYIGPADLPWDDIRPLVNSITKEKIHLHLSSNITVKKNSFLHFFPHFTLTQLIDGSLATFMTQFDACISVFNFDICSSLDRFRTSYPSRFLFALNAGIPIVMPKGYMAASENFVDKYRIGFAYENISDLKQRLTDTAVMLKYKNNSISETVNFRYEKNLNKLEKFLRAV